MFTFGELWSVAVLLESVHELGEDGEGTAEGVLGAVWGWTGLVVVVSPVTKFHRF